MIFKKRTALTLNAVLLGACASLPEAPATLATVSADDHQLMLSRAGVATVIHEAESEIEAVAGNGRQLLWIEDAEAALWAGELGDQRLDANKLANLDHDADGLCFAPVAPGVFDVLISDGDGRVFQYWLDWASQSLRPVRSLHTNPDIEQCLLTANELLLNDPYLGPVRADRNPESDAILQPLAAPLTAAQQSQLDSGSYLMFADTLHGMPEPEVPGVHADRETTPVQGPGDAADDPAILAAADGNFWVVGTDKKRGLAVYSADGELRHFLPEGRENNVDALPLGDDRFLLAASNRTHKSIDLFMADMQADSIALTQRIPVSLEDPYGLCMGRNATGQPLVFIGDSEGRVEYWRLAGDQASKRRDFDFDSQTEGCVYDARRHLLYVGQEDRGIWQIDPESGERRLIESIEQGHLVADVEGLDIYDGEQRWLIASSQGDDSYVVYELDPWRYVAKFRIVPDYARGIDGVSETDGLAVSTAALTGYPKGVLVVQDGRNRAPAAPQNFKLVDWRQIEALLNAAP